jgi:PleD family two-component response regulator
MGSMPSLTILLTLQITEQCATNGIEDGAGRTIRSYFDVYGQYEVLSVDDDAVNQMVVEGMLRPTGYKVSGKSWRESKALSSNLLI